MTNQPDVLDTMLHVALDADAENAPDLPAEWGDFDRPQDVGKTSNGHGSRSRPALVAAAWIATAAAVIGVLVGIGDLRGAPTAPATQPSPWTPTGSEFPAVDLGLATGQLMGTGVVELSHSISIADHPPVQVADVIAYAGGTTAEVSRCIWWDDGATTGGGIAGGGCDTKTDSPNPHIVAMTTSPSNGDLWIWDGVPTGTAYVAYTDGDTTRWQRPVAGIAIFPNEPNTSEFAVAYTTAGDEISRVDESSRTNTVAAETAVRWADISRDDFDRLAQLTNDTARQCLEDAGGTIRDNGLVALPSDADSSSTWQACVDHTKQVISDELARLGAAFYDPIVDRPQNPEPWMNFSG